MHSERFADSFSNLIPSSIKRPGSHLAPSEPHEPALKLQNRDISVRIIRQSWYKKMCDSTPLQLCWEKVKRNCL